MDTVCPAVVYECLVFTVVKKHLGHDKISTQLHFFLEVFEIGVQIWRLEMFFGISGYADTKIGLLRIFHILVQVSTVIHIDHMLQEVGSISMTTRRRDKRAIALAGIPSQYEHIINT